MSKKLLTMPASFAMAIGVQSPTGYGNQFEYVPEPKPEQDPDEKEQRLASAREKRAKRMLKKLGVSSKILQHEEPTTVVNGLSKLRGPDGLLFALEITADGRVYLPEIPKTFTSLEDAYIYVNKE